MPGHYFACPSTAVGFLTSIRSDKRFVTWRLYGSLPPNRSFTVANVRSGKAFDALDRLLDQTLSGPFHLRQPELADMVVEAIHYNAFVLGHYELHAFVVMPNHVHVLVTPTLALCKLTKSLKGSRPSGPTQGWH